jgi:hypothetical protein
MEVQGGIVSPCSSADSSVGEKASLELNPRGGYRMLARRGRETETDIEPSQGGAKPPCLSVHPCIDVTVVARGDHGVGRHGGGDGGGEERGVVNGVESPERPYPWLGHPNHGDTHPRVGPRGVSCTHPVSSQPCEVLGHLSDLLPPKPYPDPSYHRLVRTYAP